MNKIRKPFSFIASLLLIFSFLLFNSCSDDDDSGGSQLLIIGVWATEVVDFELSIDEVPLVEYLINDVGMPESEAELLAEAFTLLLEEEIGNFEIELKEDNTYVANFEDGIDTGKWAYDAGSGFLTINPDDPDEDLQMIKVKSLTASGLIIEQSETIEEDVDDDGTPEVIDVAIEMIFIRS
jgi:hypothetical protein